MTTSSSAQSGVRRWVTHNRIFVVLGVIILALLLVGSILPRFIITSLKQLPEDSRFESATEPTTALLIDAPAYRAGQVPAANVGRPGCEGEEPDFSCFLISSEVQLERVTTTSPSEKKKAVEVQSLSTLNAGDTELYRLDDQVRLTVDSAFPVPEPASSVALSLPGVGLSVETGEFSRTGLQYFFPFTTERVSYDFFDPLAQVPAPLDFVDLVEHEGMRAFHFQQDLKAVNLMSSLAHAYTQPDDISDAPELDPLLRPSEMSAEELESISGLRIGGPAGRFYDTGELAAHGFSTEERISLSPYYAVDRSLWVEPASGVTLDREEEVYLYLAADQEEATEMADAFAAGGEANPNRTLFAGSLAWDGVSQAAAREEAQSNKSILKVLEVISLSSNTIITILVIAGLLIFLRNRFRAARKLES